MKRMMQTIWQSYIEILTSFCWFLSDHKLYDSVKLHRNILQPIHATPPPHHTVIRTISLWVIHHKMSSEKSLRIMYCLKKNFLSVWCLNMYIDNNNKTTSEVLIEINPDFGDFCYHLKYQNIRWYICNFFCVLQVCGMNNIVGLSFKIKWNSS